ncbi:Transcription factor vrtR1 [Pseudocercospora fuligena]|uniref:Transcription factor vrtR1 n=1 Tax=Pseudocercospora fuligena TaxID=685502 RepID=A0A8H6RME9_9PEZI|nr:Transcription factor vrtR1 [Pseudocercospora fuligena]
MNVQPSPQQHAAPKQLVPIAPASHVSPAQQNGGEQGPLMPFTCVTCARRKVRCDKNPAPCGACKKGRLECFYQEPPPRKRKRKPVDDLQERLDRYEKLLTDYGILPKEGESSISPTEANATPTNAPRKPEENKHFKNPGDELGFRSVNGSKKAILLRGEGKTRYIDSGIWRNLGEDLHPSSDEDDPDDDEQTEAPYSAGATDPASAAFFSPSTSTQSLIDIHPTYDVAMKLWKLYVRNVEPIIKVVHQPTTQDIIQRAATNPSGMSKVTEIGQRMGLHRDGEDMGLSPFDVQMRRRLFWQLLPLDGLSGQLSGTGIAISADSWDTKQPLNVNDEDIWPGMEAPPVEKKGATDMIFCRARSEIGKFHQKVKPALGNWSKLWEAKDLPLIHDALQELEDIMEEKYIRYCDISIPIHCLTLGLARGAINSARLRIRMGRAKIDGATPEERKDMYKLGLKVLDLDVSIMSNGNLSRYHWHMRAFFQWDPLIWLLTEVQREDTLIDPEEAWQKVDQVFSHHPELTSWKRSIDVALARLVMKSWNGMKWKDNTARSWPFVENLREAFERKQASRGSSSDASKHTPINPFDPGAGGDTLDDIPIDNYLSASTIPWGYPNYGLVPETNAAADLDWMLWDQLTRDPSAQGIQLFPGS